MDFERAAPGEAQRLHDAAVALRDSGDVAGERRTFAELAERFGHAEDPEDAFQAAIAELELADLDMAARDDAGAAGHAGAAWAIGERLTANGVPSGAFLALQAGPRLARSHLARDDADTALRSLRETLEVLGVGLEPALDTLIPCARRVGFLLISNKALAPVGPLLEELVRFAAGLPAPAESEARTALGETLEYAGNAPAALTAYRDALAARPAGSPADDLARAELMTLAGAVADRLGQYAAAARMYDSALEIRERLLPADDPERILARYNVAELERYGGGDLDHAADELEAVAKALRAQPQANPDLLSLTLKNLAQARSAQDRPGDAEALIREALALDVGGAPRRAQLLVALARAQRALRLSPDVVPELESLAQEILAAEGPESRRYLWLLGSLAPLLPDDQADRALALYRQVVDSIGEPQDGQERDTAIGALANLGVALWSRGEHDDALEAFRRASQQQEQARAETWRIRSALETDDSDPIPVAAAVVELVHRHLLDRDDARRVAFRIGTGAKRLQAEVLGRQRELVLEGEEDLLAVRSLASRLRTAEAAGAEPDAAQEATLDDLDALLAQRVSPEALLDAFESSDPQAVSESLPRGSVLVEYLRCGGLESDVDHTSAFARATDWYVAFVLPAQHPGQLVLVDLGEAKPIDEAVLALRAAVAGAASPDASPEAWQRAGRAAAELVWDPIAPQIGVDTAVIVAPDGQIGALPFDALVTANGQPLLTQLVVTAIGTGRDTRLLDHRPNWSSAEPLVIGAPDFGEPWAPFPPLPGTQDEAKHIGALLGVEPATEQTATRELLLGVSDPEILHLATHGYYLPAAEPSGLLGAQLTAFAARNPLLATGVALADANRRVAGDTGGFAGVVSALDILGLELYGTDLTVLSACDSGLGPLDDGEGLVSLARSFFLAGARSVLWTLWQVNDWATARIMEGFYKRILRATPRGVALYRAKRDLHALYPDRPDLWAGYVLQGDPAELLRYRPLVPPPEQTVRGTVTKEGDVTYFDSRRRISALFELPFEGGESLTMGTLEVRNLAVATAGDLRVDAKRAFRDGRYQESADALLEALTMLDASSAAAQQLAADLHADLTIVLGYAGDVERSLEQGLLALTAYEQLEDWPLKLGPVLDNVAAAEVALGRLDEARAHYERALAVKRQERPGGHPSIDFTLARLAELDERTRPPRRA